MEKDAFVYQYSSKRNNEVERIRSKYVPVEKTELDALRELDGKVSRPANIFSYVFGSISAIIMGAGMSFVMTDLGTRLGFGDMMVQGIIIGTVGLGLALINYPIYKRIVESRRTRYGKEIIELSEKIING